MTMNQELLRKLQAEAALSPDEQLQLDLELETGHGWLRAQVGALSDEWPSMVWRSALNDALRAAAQGEVAEKVGLDVALDATAVGAVPRLIQALPEEEPSLTWRSELNEKLRAVRAPRRRLFDWRLGGAIAFVGAGALALLVLLNPGKHEVPAQPSAEHTIEARLVAAHQESTSAMDLGASNLAPPTSGGQRGHNWSEVDLETL